MNGMRDATINRKEWVPLASEIAFKGSMFNWVAIPSSNMKLVVEAVKHTDINLRSHFFISAYMMDILCAQHTFHKMKWSWNPSDVLIHAYCDKLWDLKYKSNYEIICNAFLIPLYRILTDRLAYCMSE